MFCSDFCCHQPDRAMTVEGSSASSVLIVSVPAHTPPLLAAAPTVWFSVTPFCVWLAGIEVAMNFTTRSSEEPGAICVPGAGGFTSVHAGLLSTSEPSVSGVEPVLRMRSVPVSWTTLFGGWYVTNVCVAGSHCCLGAGGCCWI